MNATERKEQKQRQHSQQHASRNRSFATNPLLCIVCWCLLAGLGSVQRMMAWKPLFDKRSWQIYYQQRQSTGQPPHPIRCTLMQLFRRTANTKSDRLVVRCLPLECSAQHEHLLTHNVWRRRTRPGCAQPDKVVNEDPNLLNHYRIMSFCCVRDAWAGIELSSCERAERGHYWDIIDMFYSIAGGLVWVSVCVVHVRVESHTIVDAETGKDRRPNQCMWVEH